MVHKKVNLLQKTCYACRYPFTSRKKWKWEQVIYCSNRYQRVRKSQ